jgi:hypothetical protein
MPHKASSFAREDFSEHPRKARFWVAPQRVSEKSRREFEAMHPHEERHALTLMVRWDSQFLVG